VSNRQKWILKAENDLKIVKDEITMEKPATGAIRFHARQCAENLTAYLTFNNKEVRKTHDVAELISLCSEIDPEFSELNGIVSLTDCAVEIRYAEDFYFPSVEEVKYAIELAEKLKISY